MSKVIEIKCKTPSCSNTFEIYKSEIGRKMYCSRACRSKHHWSTASVLEKRCKNPACNNVIQRKFKTKLDRVHYCCKECRKKYESTLVPMIAESICKTCGEEILTSREPCGKLVPKKLCKKCSAAAMKLRGHNRYNKINERYRNDAEYRSRIQKIKKVTGEKQSEKYKKEGLPPKWIKWYTKFSSFGKSKIEDRVVDFLKDKVAEVKRWYPISNMIVDIFVPEKNLVIECQGDYWHMNPKKYSAADYNKTIKKTAAEQWEKDKNRRLYMEYAGYTVVELWESEINGKDYSKLDIYL